eukprot:1145617-Pelagomonas_calceolata.AAC.7
MHEQLGRKGGKRPDSRQITCGYLGRSPGHCLCNYMSPSTCIAQVTESCVVTFASSPLNEYTSGPLIPRDKSKVLYGKQDRSWQMDGALFCRWDELPLALLACNKSTALVNLLRSTDTW